MVNLRESEESLIQRPHVSFGQVAQLVEHGPEKAGVGGSSPPLTTFSHLAQLFFVLLGRLFVARRARFRVFGCSRLELIPRKSPGVSSAHRKTALDSRSSLL